MISEAIPGEILPGDIPLGGGEAAGIVISAGKLSRFGEVTRKPLFVGFKATNFGPVTIIASASLTGLKATNFGPVYAPQLRAIRLSGFKAAKFSMAGVLPSYNPIRENWVRQLRGFKLLKFGD